MGRPALAARQDLAGEGRAGRRGPPQRLQGGPWGAGRLPRRPPRGRWLGVAPFAESVGLLSAHHAERL